ncbi:MAG: hypothetical protein K1W00_06665 [Lachnospiraceae bacterium]
MKRVKRLLTAVFAVFVLSNLVIMSGCGTEDEKIKTKTSSAEKEAVNSIKETKLENYKTNIESVYIHHASGLGLWFSFEVKFENMSPSYDAYVCNDMSSLMDEKILKENDIKYKELLEGKKYTEEELNGEKLSLWYTDTFYSKVSYDAGEKVNIDWAPHPIEENYSKYSKEEEYLKTGYMYLVLKEGENITGFMVFEIPVSVTDKGEYEQISYEKVNILEAVTFEKTDGKYQNVSLDYVKSRVDNILENK